MLHTVTMSYARVSAESMKVLDVLAELPTHEGVMAVALTLARLLRAGDGQSPDPNAEKAFTEDLLQWCEAYQSGEGSMN